MNHFTLTELCQSDTAVRMGIDNMPPPDVVLNLNYLMDGLEVVRNILGDKPIRVSSGYRSEALERVLCGKDFKAWCIRHGKTIDEWSEYFKNKAHPKGYACDFTCPEFGTPAQIVEKLRKMPMRYDQLICEGTWVHISFDPALRGQTLVATFNKDGIPSYSQS